MSKKDFPGIHFYDQDFVDVYDQSWAWIEDQWKTVESNGKSYKLMSHPESPWINQFESIFTSFFLVYSNRKYPCFPQLDFFYEHQEEDGAIRPHFNIESQKFDVHPNNPQNVSAPLFAWAEYNLYHKVGNKKRIKEIMPILEAYFSWLDGQFKDENGLYKVGSQPGGLPSPLRKDAAYAIDFNSQQALNALYMAQLGDILNEKDLSFKYMRQYFALKTKISQLMWNEELQSYVDLDAQGEQILVRSLAGFWPLLAEIPTETRAEDVIQHLKNPESFGSPNPFPTIALDQEGFEEQGGYYSGAVYPQLTYMTIKGLEKYGAYDLARSASIRHLYYLLDTLHPDQGKKGSVWEAYHPLKEGPAICDRDDHPKDFYMPTVGLSTIGLIIENVIGLYVSLPKKTVDWIVPTMEAMGIDNLSLKRNNISILSSKSSRGWEIRLESEKLYYFTINIIGIKRRTLPIPSGKCSMLIDKI